MVDGFFEVVIEEVRGGSRGGRVELLLQPPVAQVNPRRPGTR